MYKKPRELYKPLSQFAKQTDELKKLIAEHPDYPIVVLCNSDVVCDDGDAWWYAPSLRFSIGEILDCEQDICDGKVFFDRDDFEEAIQCYLEYEDYTYGMTDEEFSAEIKRIEEKYEPYWKKVITIIADV